LTLRHPWHIFTRVFNRWMIPVSAGLLLALTFSVRNVQPVRADNPDCGLLQDCTMDGFYGDSGAGSGAWKMFKLSGTPGIDLAPVEGWPKGPSVHLRGTNVPFDAGIRQTVAVTPGLGYHFDLAWAVETIDGKGWQDGYQINRRLGIDPFGGTDANSPNVQWSSDYFGNGKFALAFDSYAQAPLMTVFVRVGNPYTDHVVDVYLDTASLKVNTGMPPITVNAPTPTQPPATRAPSSTARPTREANVVALAPTPTEMPSETIVPTATVEPSDTAEPSATSTRLPTRVRRFTPTAVVEDGTTTRTQALVVIGATGLVGIGVAGILFALAFFYWLRSKN
jgi:hypothetical protein